ncbi:MAG: hypothetical protein ACE5H9_05980 [Anaerolineae bacterium]
MATSELRRRICLPGDGLDGATEVVHRRGRARFLPAPADNRLKAL